MSVKAWWFSSSRVLPHGDGRSITIGRTHKVEGEIIPCENGLHGSVRPLDALDYAPGPIVWRVRLSGTVVPHAADKHAASERTYVAGGVDAAETLHKFARLCALDVIHLWEAPTVVVNYLKTGDESLRDAARSAAWSVARDAACSAARDVARDAARSAAWSGAWSAAWSVAWRKQDRRLTRMLNKLIKEDLK